MVYIQASNPMSLRSLSWVRSSKPLRSCWCFSRRTQLPPGELDLNVTLKARGARSDRLNEVASGLDGVAVLYRIGRCCSGPLLWDAGTSVSRGASC